MSTTTRLAVTAVAPSAAERAVAVVVLAPGVHPDDAGATLERSVAAGLLKEPTPR